MKSRTASSDSGNAEVMKRSLKKDVKGHVHREVDTQTFIKEVWGLPAGNSLNYHRIKPPQCAGYRANHHRLRRVVIE